MGNAAKLKTFPQYGSDAEAEAFVETADLACYDFSSFKPVQFEFERKDARLELRMPQVQLVALKALAVKRGIPYTRLVRQFIDQGLRDEKG
jgi:predicted DNA binding CopG/RHH family protein